MSEIPRSKARAPTHESTNESTHLSLSTHFLKKKINKTAHTRQSTQARHVTAHVCIWRFKNRCACHEIRASRSTHRAIEVAHATKSAGGTPQCAAPTAKICTKKSHRAALPARFATKARRTPETFDMRK